MIERYPRFICVNKFPLWITEKSGTPSVIFLELFFTICAARAISRNKQTIIIYFFIFALCRMERCILIRLRIQMTLFPVSTPTTEFIWILLILCFSYTPSEAFSTPSSGSSNPIIFVNGFVSIFPICHIYFMGEALLQGSETLALYPQNDTVHTHHTLLAC